MSDKDEDVIVTLTTDLNASVDRIYQLGLDLDALRAEVERLRALIGNADSMLSLIRHRGNVKWGGDGFAESYEVDHLIGELRRASQT